MCAHLRAGFARDDLRTGCLSTDNALSTCVRISEMYNLTNFATVVRIAIKMARRETSRYVKLSSTTHIDADRPVSACGAFCLISCQ